MLNQTPIGVMDFVPSDAQAHQQQYQTLATYFDQEKFSPIRTPTIEYADALNPGLCPHLTHSAIRFVDPTGNLLMLRPEHTTPVARMVATHMKNESLPLKVYYMDPIFRQPDKNGNTEIFKAGCEWIGEESVSSDIAIIGHAIHVLKKLGHENIHVDIGHVNFTKTLSSDQKQHLIKGDYLNYGQIPARGGIELVKDDPTMHQLMSGLAEHGHSCPIAINKGLIQSLNYYTGIVFEIIVEGFSDVIISGGRYDKLLSLFGYDQPAVGFAINLTALREGAQ